MKNFYYIQSLKNLNSFLPLLRSQTQFAFDTEFRRVETYYPISSLLQINFGGSIYIIDLLSRELNKKQVFKNIFEDNPANKICHSGRQDLEILYYYLDSRLNNIIDTQIASKHAGLGKEISYGRLCGQLLNIEIDKKNQFSNWTKRPLEEEQLYYAAEDVRYLEELFDQLRNTLINKSAYSEFKRDCEELENKDNFILKPELAWKKIKSAKYYESDSRIISRLKQIASLREKSAMKLNLPRKRTLSDEAVIKLAKNPPQTSTKLGEIPGISRNFKQSEFFKKLLRQCIETSSE
jgi:ribonuclease D